MDKLFHIFNRQCYKRIDETRWVVSFLIKNGWSNISDPKAADLVLFFTCAFCKSQANQTILSIEKAMEQRKPGSIFIVGGCLTKIDIKSLQKVFKGKIITPTDFSALNDLPGLKIKVEESFADFSTLNDLPGLKIKVEEALIHKKIFSLQGLGKKVMQPLYKKGIVFTLKKACQEIKNVISHARAKACEIQICKGCNRRCSYCAIRFGVGPLKSKSPERIFCEVKDVLNSGYRKIDLFGDCIGDYGFDRHANFGDLLEMLVPIKKKFKVGIYGLHPESFLKYFNQIEKLCKMNRLYFIYMPIQSANPKILKLMKRPYDIDKVKQKILKLKKYAGMSVRSGIIIGFPSETEADFEDTANFLKEISADHNWIHFYSDMPNTESSKLEGKVDKATMVKRYNKLKDLGIKHNEVQVEYELNYM